MQAIDPQHYFLQNVISFSTLEPRYPAGATSTPIRTTFTNIAIPQYQCRQNEESLRANDTRFMLAVILIVVLLPAKCKLTVSSVVV